MQSPAVLQLLCLYCLLSSAANHASRPAWFPNGLLRTTSAAQLSAARPTDAGGPSRNASLLPRPPPTCHAALVTCIRTSCAPSCWAYRCHVHTLFSVSPSVLVLVLTALPCSTLLYVKLTCCWLLFIESLPSHNYLYLYFLTQQPEASRPRPTLIRSRLLHSH